MVSGVKKDYGDIFYMRVKKHNCPDCGGPVFLRKVKRKVRSTSRSAADYNFRVGDTTLSGKVKFIWYEFRCKNCGNQYTEAQMRAFEEKKKAMEKAEKKRQRKQEKQNKKAEGKQYNINIDINIGK